MVIGLGVYRQQPSLDWAPARILIPATRGGGEPVANRTELEEYAKSLENVVRSLYDARTRQRPITRLFRSGPPWILSTIIEVEPGGSVHVEVRAQSRGEQEAPLQWAQSYPDTASLARELQKAALDISSELMKAF